MKWTIVLTGLLMLAGTARATNYYLSDCQAGHEPGCLAGSDANNGTDPATPWLTFDKAFSIFRSLQGGDQILFARGGSFAAGNHPHWANYNHDHTNPIVIGDYIPSWSSGANRPILTETQAGGTIFSFLDDDIPTHDEGYIVKNLELRGNNQGSYGVTLNNDVDFVTLDNLVIHDFVGIGVICGDGFSSQDPSDPSIKNPRLLDNDHITLTNSSIFNNSNMGYLGGCNDVLIAGNTFDNNGSGSKFNHNVYIAAPYRSYKNIIVRNNTLTHSSVVNGQCSGTSFVIHGPFQGLVIENNTVQEDIGAVNGGCWGIAMQPYSVAVDSAPATVIRGNRVINVGGMAIGATSCPNCVIENNVIVQEQPSSALGDNFWGIEMPIESLGVSLANTNAVIRNNSIYISSVKYGEGIYLGSPGTGLVVVNNAVHYAGTSGGVAGFQLQLAPASYTAVDNNIFYSPNSSGSRWEGSRGQTLTQWRATGFDVDSSTANPFFASPATPNFDLSIPANSPAVDKGNVANASPVDINGQTRDIHPDIGAYEYFAGGAVPPAAPTGLAATAVSSTTINLTWTAPAGAVTGYRIHRGIVWVGSSGTTAFLDTGLTPSTLYKYTVRALNGSGLMSNASNEASSTTLAAAGGGGPGGGTTPSSVALLDTAAFPNPAVGKDPTIRVFVGDADELEITIYDAAGSVVHTDRVAGGPTGTASNGKPYYDYVWTGKKASGVYYAVIHGKKGGDVVRARVKFAVVR